MANRARTKLESKGLRVAGLFAGIGGLELGLERAGHETMLLCEINEGAAAVLRARFPDVPIVGDVRDIDALPRGTQLVAAGFPCQDLSQAGHTRGINGKKSGVVTHLLNLIAKRSVPKVLIENVPFMLQLDRGGAMRFLTSRLEKLGYKWAYRVVDTMAFGIPQRRERVFLLASRRTHPARLLFADDAQRRLPVEGSARAFGFYWTEGTRGLGWAVESVPTLKSGSSIGIPSPPAIWLAGEGIVTPDIRDAERLQGFEADWTLPAESTQGVRRNFRWTMVGNAVTVDVAEWVGNVLKSSPGHLPADIELMPVNKAWPKAGYGAPGSKRYKVNVSTWPVCNDFQPISDFLAYKPHPLSDKAARGFYNRYRNGSLRKKDDFLRALAKYVSTRSNSKSGVKRSKRVAR